MRPESNRAKRFYTDLNTPVAGLLRCKIFPTHCLPFSKMFALADMLQAAAPAADAKEQKAVKSLDDGKGHRFYNFTYFYAKMENGVKVVDTEFIRKFIALQGHRWFRYGVTDPQLTPNTAPGKCPEHCQSHVDLRCVKTWKQIKEVISTCCLWPSTAHIEIAHHPYRSQQYCIEDEKKTRDPFFPSAPFEFGIRLTMGQCEDYLGLRDMAIEGKSDKHLENYDPLVFAKHSRALREARRLNTPRREYKPLVWWFFGPPGTGKSFKAETMGANFGNGLIYDGLTQTSSLWFDGYDIQDTLLIHDPETMPTQDFLRWTDKYPMQVSTKNGTAPFSFKQVIITSNKSPKFYFPSDRWAAVTRRINIEKMTTVYVDPFAVPLVRPAGWDESTPYDPMDDL